MPRSRPCSAAAATLLGAASAAVTTRGLGPPVPSQLASLRWWPQREVRPDEIRAFDEDSFVVLRGVIDLTAVSLLYNESRRICARRFRDTFSGPPGVCQIEQLRWQEDAFRDFLFHGPLGRLVHALIRRSGVRVYQDAMFALRYHPANESDSYRFFSYRKGGHVDGFSDQRGVWGGFHSNVSAAAMWMPLTDVDSDTDGGAIVLHRGWVGSSCSVACAGRTCPGPTHELTISRQLWAALCETYRWNNKVQAVALSLKRGDVVFWHPGMLHKSQPVHRPGALRFAWTARFVESDAVVCARMRCGVGNLPCCKGPFPRAGERAHGPCMPQIFPELLEDEVRAHFSPDAPAPLLDPWLWRYDHPQFVNSVCEAPTFVD